MEKLAKQLKVFITRYKNGKPVVTFFDKNGEVPASFVKKVIVNNKICFYNTIAPEKEASN